jgi:hypothetical protein
LIPARLLDKDATPEAFVTAEPAGEPFNVKFTVFPLTAEPPAVRVADRLAEPPYVPVAGETLREVVACAGATVQLRLAGVGSTLPAASIALTLNV